MRCFFVLTALATLSVTAPTQADEAISTDDLEGRFRNLTLVGQFTIDRPGVEGKPGKPERYEIAGIKAAKNGQYIIQSRIKYGEHDVTVPVPVDLNPGGRASYTVSLDDLAIPLLGDGFAARVIFDFDSNRYAGTWKHGKVGGHMWGRLEQATADE